MLPQPCHPPPLTQSRPDNLRRPPPTRPRWHGCGALLARTDVPVPRRVESWETNSTLPLRPPLPHALHPPLLLLRMAAVAVPPSPQVVDVMANRRVPLANLHNATNSPMRAAAIGGKRQRSHASEQRDLSYGQPPAKKLMVETDDADARRSGLIRRSAAPPTALTKKLEAAREQKAEHKVVSRATRPNTRGPEVTASNLETIRNWQRHYRKLFPQFVFWFESVPDDIKSKVSRQAQILGSVRTQPHCTPYAANMTPA